MKTTTISQARIDFRTTSETKLLIERAASLSGMTVSDFATTVLTEKSREVLQASETRILTDRDRDLFLGLLDAQQPAELLAAAAARFKNAVEHGELIP